MTRLFYILLYIIYEEIFFSIFFSPLFILTGYRAAGTTASTSIPFQISFLLLTNGFFYLFFFSSLFFLISSDFSLSSFFIRFLVFSRVRQFWQGWLPPPRQNNLPDLRVQMIDVFYKLGFYLKIWPCLGLFLFIFRSL